MGKFFIIIIAATSLLFWSFDYEKSGLLSEEYVTNASLKLKAQKAKEFIADNGYSANVCILVDMSIHSGKKRLFLYDLKKDSVLLSGLCSHGCCEHNWGSDQTKTNPKFNNIPDSHCSSLGKFKIGKRGYSQWGIHVNYKLHGLESTNSKAYKRYIVLHSWDMVPERELYPSGTPEGWGCPAVSNNTMRKLDEQLKKESKPVLLWIYQ